MSVVSADLEPLTFLFHDDGIVPNNPLPLLLYKAAVDVDSAHPEKTIEGLFGANGWRDMWRNGVYGYLHYHATVHEALGIARGRALVRFGGDAGRDLEIAAGDVAILPAGTGHQCLSASADLSVVGAIHRVRKCRSRARPRTIMRRRSRPFRKSGCRRPIRSWVQMVRWSGCGIERPDRAALESAGPHGNRQDIEQDGEGAEQGPPHPFV